MEVAQYYVTHERDCLPHSEIWICANVVSYKLR